MKYDVFISYKRDGGKVWAELVRTILVYKYHLSVFLDVSTMQGGEWLRQINNAINDSRNVIMVLFKNLEDRIQSENDPFIQEITLAEQYNKPIVPFFSDDCDFCNIIECKTIPNVIKDIVSKQHSIVKYYHHNTETTYELLRKQLHVKLELNICSQYDYCYMKYYIDNKPSARTKIENNGHVTISLERSFTGMVDIEFYTETRPKIIKFLIYVRGKYSEKISPDYTEICYWKPDEEIEKQIDIDWLWIDRKIKENSMTNQSYNPMEIVGTIYQYLDK